MNKLYILFSFCLSIFAFSQNADEIIQQNLEKSGGIAKWKSLNSIILKGDVTLGLEQSFPLHVYHRRPYEKKVVYFIKGQEILSEGYDGKSGWTYNEISGKNEKVPNYQPDSFDSDLLDYDKKGFEAKYIGKDKVEGKECHKIQLIKNTNVVTYCISTKDYTLLSEETDKETMYYYDYKTFEGLRFATRIVAYPKEGGEYVLRFASVQINPQISDKTFKF